MKNFNIIEHNENAWDKKVQDECIWSKPVSKVEIEEARNGILKVSLGAKSTVPRNWFPDSLIGLNILCLASGGGQQGPIFAAHNANVVVFDISPEQLNKDRSIAESEDLKLDIVQGDMCDLSAFTDEKFDLVFCPVAITYIPELTTFYSEVNRVLKSQGIFMLGSANPHIYLYDAVKWDQGIYKISNTLPFNSFDELNQEESRNFIKEGNAIEYSHTLNDIIGGQLSAGFVIDQFYEENDGDKIAKHFNNYFATRAIKSK